MPLDRKTLFAISDLLGELWGCRRLPILIIYSPLSLLQGDPSDRGSKSCGRRVIDDAAAASGCSLEKRRGKGPGNLQLPVNGIRACRRSCAYVPICADICQCVPKSADIWYNINGKQRENRPGRGRVYSFDSDTFRDRHHRRHHRRHQPSPLPCPMSWSPYSPRGSLIRSLASESALFRSALPLRNPNLGHDLALVRATSNESSPSRGEAHLQGTTGPSEALAEHAALSRLESEELSR
jgi:hypothetical protein